MYDLSFFAPIPVSFLKTMLLLFFAVEVATALYILFIMILFVVDKIFRRFQLKKEGDKNDY